MKTSNFLIILLAVAVAGLAALAGAGNMDGVQKVKKMSDTPENIKIATFAGGCFWCVESDFEKVDGVVRAVSGYTGGPEENPTYKEVSYGKTGHLEAVQVHYDPDRITYEELLDVFWRHVDPTDNGGQFVDRGNHYRPAIFHHDEEQKRLAEASRNALEASKRFDKPIVTEIRKFDRFYNAEDYHQDYYKKSPLRYKLYRSNSGRDQFLKKTWATKGGTSNRGENRRNEYTRPSDDVIRKRLSPLQYQVARENGTEPPFANEFWDNKKPGLYVDVVSGEPLFSSLDKFESGTGWPSFTTPVEPDNIVEKTDVSHFMTRTEVRSRHGDSHLGHLFADGPEPTGLRYCINSASLRFVPVDRLEEEGYGRYAGLFMKN